MKAQLIPGKFSQVEFFFFFETCVMWVAEGGDNGSGFANIFFTELAISTFVC